jgi:toxin ParE1/3/4
VPDLEWKASAVADLMAIVDYISDDNPDAALALMDEIQGKVEQLPAHPNAAALAA